MPRRRSTADWCEKHYMRWYRNGDPLSKKERSYQDLSGQKFGALLVLTKDEDSRYTNWICLCDCGVTKSIRAFTLTSGSTKSCGDFRVHSRRDLKGTYTSVHTRLNTDIGPANNFDCIVCGNQAKHWAYDHKDPDEVWQQERQYLVPFSTKQEHYQPMCVPCHKLLDISERPKFWHSQ